MAGDWTYVDRRASAARFCTKMHERIIIDDPAYGDESVCEISFNERLGYMKAHTKEEVHVSVPEAGSEKMIWSISARDSNYNPPMRWVEIKVDGADDLVAAPFETTEELRIANYEQDSFPHAKMVWVWDGGLTIYATLLYHEADSTTAKTFETDMSDLLLKMGKAFKPDA